MARKWSIPVVALVLAVAALALASQRASADPRDFTLHNDSNVTIVAVFVQPSGPGDDWGDDILGVDVLLPGESAFVYFTRFDPESCLYDIKVVSEDGEAELIEQDLCSTTDLSFT